MCFLRKGETYAFSGIIYLGDMQAKAKRNPKCSIKVVKRNGNEKQKFLFSYLMKHGIKVHLTKFSFK